MFGIEFILKIIFVAAVFVVTAGIIISVYFQFRREYYRWTEEEQIRFIRHRFDSDESKTDVGEPPKNWDSSMTDR